MFPWDFDRHLDSQHSRYKVCQQYLVNEMLQDHMELEHLIITAMPLVTEEQVTRDSATLETDHQDRQVKCKYCDRYFRNVAECNMHVNRRHKRVKCPQSEKCFVKQTDCDNHFRDEENKKNIYDCNECLWHFNTVAGLIKHFQNTHDDKHFACTTCREVFASNPNLCTHTKSHHIKLFHLCHRIFVSDDELFAHIKEIHLGSIVRTQEEMIEDEQS